MTPRLGFGSALAPSLALAMMLTLVPGGVGPLSAQGSIGDNGGGAHPGNGTLYIGTYTSIVVIDEASGQIEDEIFLQTGIPRSMVLSDDGERFYVLNTMYETIEVVDVRTRRSIDQFTLSSGNRKIRIWGYTIDPQERYAILLVKSYDRLPDRFDVSRPYLIRYDLETRAVTDSIAWPDGQTRENARLLFSPEGDYLYFFADDILVLETGSFTEVDRWAYEDTMDEGMGSFEFGFPAQAFEEPGYFTGLFRVTEPIQGRRLMGVARVHLASRDVEFFTLGPNENISFQLAPGGTKAYGLRNQVGNYEFWTFDLERRRVENRQQFPGRPRMSLMPSSSGEVLYIYNAGNTIDLYEAATYRYMRTIDLNVDSSTSLFVIPGESTTVGGQMGGN
jgi:hypothetical protein